LHSGVTSSGRICRIHHRLNCDVFCHSAPLPFPCSSASIIAGDASLTVPFLLFCSLVCPVCRYCGRVFCADCTPHNVMLPVQFGYSDPQRVCQVRMMFVFYAISFLVYCNQTHQWLLLLFRMGFFCLWLDTPPVLRHCS
jgi:hypothetical protein